MENSAGGIEPAIGVNWDAAFEVVGGLARSSSPGFWPVGGKVVRLWNSAVSKDVS
jgi:hypothetical protein